MKTILITGASSGIGKAVALEMAKRRYALALTARRIEALQDVRKEIRQTSPDAAVEVQRLDVTDDDAVFTIVGKLAQQMGGLDIIFANAGVGLKETIGKGQFENSRKNVEVNLIGAMATVDAAVSHFLERGAGHVVGNCSVAVFRGMAGNGSYGASKAGFANYLEALRVEVYRKNIDVTVLYPGYISTELSDSLHTRPFVISPEKAATIIAYLIEKKAKSGMVPAFPWNIIGRLLKILPLSVISKL
ncbi:MAG: SDR family NAD(P)-dependent oxidoreductase [Deltaproteobacteria bacterium]|nr:SDR family NAD(P)-dependent oxidoreductase [Deltaproteobacteria bacterium]